MKICQYYFPLRTTHAWRGSWKWGEKSIYCLVQSFPFSFWWECLLRDKLAKAGHPSSCSPYTQKVGLLSAFASIPPWYHILGSYVILSTAGLQNYSKLITSSCTSSLKRRCVREGGREVMGHTATDCPIPKTSMMASTHWGWQNGRQGVWQ